MKRVIASIGLAATLVVIVLAGNPARHRSPAPVLPSGDGHPIVTAQGKLPLIFEGNQGQFDPEVRFVARASAYSVLLTPTETILSPLNESDTSVDMTWLGVNSESIEGFERLSGTSHYFRGKERAKWVTGVPHYGRVRYRNAYPGVDLIFYGNQQNIEYDFIVAPGADPKQIRFRVTGARRVELDDHGELVIGVVGSEVRLRRPTIYQGEGQARRQIEGGYALAGNEVTFELDRYDSTRPLVIDPVLVYSTYLGGSGSETLGSAIFVDDAGSIFLTGRTGSLDFPTLNAFQPQKGGPVANSNAYVAKLSADGQNLIYATYLGSNDDGRGIVVDRSGNAYVTGRTNSADFPITTNAWQRTFGGGPSDGWVTKLSPDGSTLLYSTFLGGSGTDNGNFLIVDSQGNATIAGATNSTDFPALAAMQAQSGGGFDGFVTKLNKDGQAIYSTYFGGAAEDRANLIAGDTQGNAYVAGRTASTNFPTLNAFQKTYGGGTFDGYVAKFNAAGNLVSSTYLGGSGADAGGQVALDAAGNIYATGTTNSPDFPITHALQPKPGGGTCGSPARACYDAYVTKLSPDGSTLIYSTYLGGSGEENEVDGSGTISVDAVGSAYVGGRTASRDFSIANASQQTYGGGAFDNFVSKLSPDGSVLLYSTYLGGTGEEGLYDVRLGPDGSVNIAGFTASTDFPTASALQSNYGGGPADFFVARLSEVLSNGVFYFAQAGGGGGFSTGVALTNPSTTQSASGTVSFFAADGRAFDPGVGNAVVSFTIQPSRSVIIETRNSGPMTSGYARVSSSAPIFANANYSFPTGVPSLSVGPSSTGSVFNASIGRHGGGIDQGIALMNVTAAWVRVTLTLRDATGNERSSNVTLASGEQLSRFLSELIPGIPNGFRGTLQITASPPLLFTAPQTNVLAVTMVEFGPGQLRNVPITVVR